MDDSLAIRSGEDAGSSAASPEAAQAHLQHAIRSLRQSQLEQAAFDARSSVRFAHSSWSSLEDLGLVLFRLGELFPLSFGVLLQALVAIDHVLVTLCFGSIALGADEFIDACRVVGQSSQPALIAGWNHQVFRDVNRLPAQLIPIGLQKVLNCCCAGFLSPDVENEVGFIRRHGSAEFCLMQWMSSLNTNVRACRFSRFLILGASATTNR